MLTIKGSNLSLMKAKGTLNMRTAGTGAPMQRVTTIIYFTIRVGEQLGGKKRKRESGKLKELGYNQINKHNKSKHQHNKQTLCLSHIPTVNVYRHTWEILVAPWENMSQVRFVWEKHARSVGN